MCALKIGKLNYKGQKGQAPISLEDYKAEREIWDDYATQQLKQKKKKEFEKGAGNRMIQKQKPARNEKDDKAFTLAEPEELEIRQVDYSSVEERLGYKFTDSNLLSMAFTHRSALGFKERADYERLEFLGDAVLDLAVAHLLSDFHPDDRQGCA